MPAPTIPVYAGSTPNRNQAPEVFSVNADAWLAYQAPLPASYNALATYLDGLAVDSEATLTGLVAQGQSLLTATEGFASAAQGAAEAAASSANFKGQWINLTGALNIPATVEHNGVLWILLNNLPDVTLSEPTSGNSDWLSDSKLYSEVNSDATVSRKAVLTDLTKTNTANVTVALNDGSFIEGDLVRIRKCQEAGLLTVNTTNNQILPDGTTATSNFFPDGKAGTVELKYLGSVWTLRII